MYPNRLLFLYSASTTESPPTTTIQSTTTSTAVTTSTSTTQSTTSSTTTDPPEPECVDSPFDMIHGRKEKYRSADWVADRAGRLCSRNSIASHFPLTCNRCDDFACEDSRKWFVDPSTDEWYLCEEGFWILLKKRFATWQVDVRLAVNYVGIVIRRRGVVRNETFCCKRIVEWVAICKNAPTSINERMPVNVKNTINLITLVSQTFLVIRHNLLPNHYKTSKLSPAIPRLMLSSEAILPLPLVNSIFH